MLQTLAVVGSGQRPSLRPAVRLKPDTRTPIADTPTIRRRSEGMIRPATSRVVLPSILFVVSVLLSAPAWAQLSTAELNGRVTDSSGAVLPGVTVTATQTATGLVRTAVTDENGAYLISNLPTGPYRLEVALQGFRTYVQTGHRAAGRRDADDQRSPRARLARGNGHRRSGGAAGGRPQRRHQRGRRERTHPRVAP